MRGSGERSELGGERGRNDGGRNAGVDAAGGTVERSEEKEGWEKWDASPRSADSNSIALPRESEVGEGER